MIFFKASSNVGSTSADSTARVVTQDWRTIYNTIRPHGSLGGLTPAEFAQICKDKEKETVTL